MATKKPVKKKVTSAKKAFEQSEKRRILNKSRRSDVKSSLKKVSDAIENAKSHDVVMDLLSKAKSKMGRATGKGTIHKNTASRKISRLTKKVNKHFEDKAN